MKKRVVICLLGLVLVLAGCNKAACDMCGEEKKCKVYENLLLGEMNVCEECADEIQSLGTEGSNIFEEENSGYQEQKPDEKVSNGNGQEKKKFEKLPDWEKYTIADKAIQIEDTMYIPGVSVADFIATVESSSIEYTYEYVPGELMTGNSTKTIVIYRDGEKWFEADACNVFVETVSLSECVVLRIKACSSSFGCCYIMDGRTYEELLTLSYAEVKDLAEEVFPFYELTEEAVEKNGKDLILLKYDGSKDGILENAKRLTGYLIKSGFDLCFYVDKTTSQVVDFEYKHWNWSRWVECPPSVVGYFKDLTEDEYNSLVEETQEQVQNKYACEEVAVVGSCLKQSGGVSFYDNMAEGVLLYPYDLCTVYELKKADGTVSYVNGQINKLLRKVTGEFEYHSIKVGDEKGSVDDVIKKHKLTKDISDTTLY